MARPRKDDSALPSYNLGLKPEEDEKLAELLKQRDLSYRQVMRALIRQWMKEGGSGILRHMK